MVNFELPRSEGAVIRVVGVGGGGGNAVKHMAANGIKNVDFILCNTDYQALVNSNIEKLIQLGPKLTEGLGAGSKPDVGRQAAIETSEEIEDAVRGAKMVFVTAGMGGGTGTGAAPIVAKVCKEQGILTIGIVTIPFKNEGVRRLRHACKGIEELAPYVDSLLVVNNERIIDIFGDLTISESFAKADDVLASAARGIAEIINVTGYMNADLSNVDAVMRNSGLALMGSGRANGANRATEALENALHSPLLNNNNVFGAKNVLICIYSSSSHEVSIQEIDTICTTMQEFAGNNADVIPGNAIDDSLGEEVSVMVIATGFDKSGMEQYLHGGDVDNQDLHQIHEGIYKPSSHSYMSEYPKALNDTANTATKRDDALNDTMQIEDSEADKLPDFATASDSILTDLENVPAYMRRRKNMKKRDSANTLLSDKGVLNDDDENSSIVTENRYLNKNVD
ncbi:MAG: cell division protein FtsZ [Bacteroidales bacterium]